MKRPAGFCLSLNLTLNALMLLCFMYFHKTVKTMQSDMTKTYKLCGPSTVIQLCSETTKHHSSALSLSASNQQPQEFTF